MSCFSDWSPCFNTTVIGLFLRCDNCEIATTQQMFIGLSVYRINCFLLIYEHNEPKIVKFRQQPTC